MRSTGPEETAGADAEAAEARLGALFERLPELVNGDADLVRRGATLDVVFQLGIGRVPYYVTVAAGRVAAVERGPLLMRSCRFTIAANAEAWSRF
jgi:hypothetical protein